MTPLIFELWVEAQLLKQQTFPTLSRGETCGFLVGILTIFEHHICNQGKKSRTFDKAFHTMESKVYGASPTDGFQSQKLFREKNIHVMGFENQKRNHVKMLFYFLTPTIMVRYYEIKENL